jgi:hypothetical protein
MPFKTREQMVNHWNAYAKKHLVGRKIVAASYMTDAERDANDWHASAIVIELDDGTVIYPMTDDEGNGPGALAGAHKTSGDLHFPVV